VDLALDEMPKNAWQPSQFNIQTAGLIQQHAEATTIMELLDKVSKKCFLNCVQYPREAFSSGESQCVQFCIGRWFESQNIVGQRLLESQTEEAHHFAQRVEETRNQIIHRYPYNVPPVWDSPPGKQPGTKE